MYLAVHSKRVFAILFVYFLFIATSIQLPVAAQLGIEDAKNRAARLCNESLPLLSSGKYDEAEQKLVESIGLDPDNSATLSNYGMLLLKRGKPAEARKQLEKALALSPKLDSANLNMGMACEGMGDLQNAKVYLLKYIDLAQDRDMIEKMRDHVIIIDKTLAKGPLVESGADYFAQLSRNQMFPWPKELMPIKIYVSPGDSVPGYVASYGDDVDLAISSWSKGLNGILSLQKTDNASEAGIEIHWAHDYKTALMKAEGGDCKYTANGAGMKHASITLLTVDPSAADKLNDAKVTWVALHELGHALGISGHSNNPGDVMYFAAPLNNAIPQLSARDIRTFTRMYTEKLADTGLSVNEEGRKLMKAGKYADALLKFNQATKMSPEIKEIKQNTITAEEELASQMLANTNWKEAEPHLRRALDLQKEIHDDNNSALLSNYAILLKKTGRANEVDALYKQYSGLSQTSVLQRRP